MSSRYNYQIVIVIKADITRLQGSDSAAYQMTGQSKDQELFSVSAPRYEDSNGVEYAVCCAWLRQQNVDALPSLLTNVCGDADQIADGKATLGGLLLGSYKIIATRKQDNSIDRSIEAVEYLNDMLNLQPRNAENSILP